MYIYGYLLANFPYFNRTGSVGLYCTFVLINQRKMKHGPTLQPVPFKYMENSPQNIHGCTDILYSYHQGNCR